MNIKQETFSRLWDGFKTDQEAKDAKNARAKELRAQGYKVSSSILKNQIKKYDGLGQPNGSVCDVYMITAYPKTVTA